jgi:phosphoglycolate phosphatase
VKTLIFDFDGTIADSFELLLAIFEQIAPRPQKLTAEEIKQIKGENLRQITKYLKIRRWQIPRLLFRGRKLLSIKILSVKPFPAIPGVLKQLDSVGLDMYLLSTNSPDNINKFLKKNGLETYFKNIYGDIGLRSKASAINRIIKKEHLNRVDCVYIGDEVRDVEAAKKAGVKSVGVTWGFNNAQAIKTADPDITANQPKDLLNI